MMKKLLLIFSCLLFSVGLVYSQKTITVAGTVVDDTGIEVVGASVVLKGTTTGVATDINGSFSLNVPENSTLVFSLIGMQTVEAKAAPSMSVVMKNDDELLDEVVVTAMGITREKKALGYASQGVKSQDLIQASNTSLSGALQGKVSGVQITPSSGMPGASSQLVIRGARSFSGNNTPLYIVDGMPIASNSDIDTDSKNNGSVSGTDYANRAVDINPNDIESIEVLKGQAAAALYGIRASNGVIVITTKSGKGLAKGKPHIEVSSSIAFDKISRYPKMQTKYAQGTNSKRKLADGTEVEYTGYNPTSSGAWGPLVSELPNDPVYGGNTDNKYTAESGKQNGKYYVPQLANAGLNPWATPGTYDNVRDFFDTGVTWSNSISVSQALDKSNYAISLAATNQDGIVPTTGMDRYNARISAETKFSSQWSAGFVANVINTEIDKAPGANDGLVATVFGAPASYNLEGIPSYYLNNPYKQNNYRSGSFMNPYWFVDNNEFKEKTTRFYGNTFVNYTTKLNSTDKKLNVKYQLGTDMYTTNYSDIWGYGNKGLSGDGQAEKYHWTVGNVNSLLVANFDWTIDDNWRANIILGNEIIHETKEYANSQGIGFAFAGWNNIENAKSFPAAVHSKNSRRSVGFFGSATASYRNMVYLGMTGREDIVSYMPRNNRSFFYPSVTASFVLTELEPLKNDVIDFAKVRFAYAEVGQAADEFYDNFYTTPTYGGGFYQLTPISYPFGGVNSYTPYNLVFDPNLKPQNTRSYEAGLDLNLLQGLFNLSYTYSRQNVKDQIFDVPLAPSTGISLMRKNAGKLHTDSHEITLEVNPINTKLVDWSFGFNWSRIDNYVDELAEGVENIMLGGFVTPQVRVSAGERFPVIYGSDFARDEQGRILVDDTGKPYTGETTVIGRVSPDFNLGFNTSIRIEKLRIAAVFDWKSGGQMYHGTNGLIDYYGVSQKTADARDNGIIFDGWKADGTKNDIKITGSKDIQSFYSTLNNIDAASIYDNSFIKLRELSASYNVFKNSIVDITLSAFARNILIWSELDNFDPEATQGNNNMGGAFERFSLPQTSSYGFGLNVKF